MLDGFLSYIFGPVMGLPNPLNLVVISFMLTFLITIIYKYMSNQTEIKALKKRMKDLQNEMKGLKDQPKRLVDMQKEVMNANLRYMSHSFKPMIITFIPIIFIFGWLRNCYTNLGNPVVIKLGFINLSWLWSYIVISIVISILLRKVLKVH